MTQIIQGQNLQKLVGTVVSKNQLQIETSRKGVFISPNETNLVKAGAFVKQDITITDYFAGVLADVNTPTQDLLFIISYNFIDRAIDGDSTADLTELNGGLKMSKNGLPLLGNAGIEVISLANDVVNVGDLLMIDSTDATKKSLIPYVDNGTNVAIAKALTASTSAGTPINIQFI